MGQGPGPKRWSAVRARELLAEAKQSGESLNAFAHRHGIDPQRLYSWRRKLDAVKGADFDARALRRLVEALEEGSR